MKALALDGGRILQQGFRGPHGVDALPMAAADCGQSRGDGAQASREGTEEDHHAHHVPNADEGERQHGKDLFCTPFQPLYHCAIFRLAFSMLVCGY